MPVFLAAVVLSVPAVVHIWRSDRHAPAAPTVARVEVAWVAEDGLTPLVRPGDSLQAGQEVASGEQGRLAIRLASGPSVRLDKQTNIRILSRQILMLDRGAVYVDSGSRHQDRARTVEVQTPLGSIRDMGAVYEVRTRPGLLLVRVRAGAVSIKDSEGLLRLGAGYELAVDSSGRTVRRRLVSYAPEWSWVASVTPPMDLEGRSLREFLDWMARERGLRLEFASASLARIAPETMLNGSIEGMSLDDALASVLAAAGMRYGIHGDALIVYTLADWEP